MPPSNRMRYLSVVGIAILGILSTSGAEPDSSDRHIVVLRQDVNMQQHKRFVQTSDLNPSHWYSFEGFQAYAGRFNQSTVDLLRSHDDVVSIEPDLDWTRQAEDEPQDGHQPDDDEIPTEADQGWNEQAEDDVQPGRSQQPGRIPRPSRGKIGGKYQAGRMIRQTGRDWGLHAISHRRRNDLDHGAYIYDSSAGRGTYAYVLDDGINTKHVEFQGRAVLGYNACKGKPFEDTFGHGTMLAGIIGSKTYGVANNCNLIAVKVVSDTSTSVSIILDGFNWTVNQILRLKQQSKAVISLSLSGPKSLAINGAIDAAAKRGITTISAVGNERWDASTRSPGSAMGAVTVGATNEQYSRFQASNWGTKVDIFAPGVHIRSTEIGSTTAVETRSGASLASGYVAGLVVYFKGMRSLPDDVSTKKCLYGTATRNIVYGPAGGRNLFAYNGNGR